MKLWFKITAWPPFAFFYSKGKFQPPYFWITAFCSLALYMFYLRLSGRTFSDTLILGVLGFIATWVAIYSWHDRGGTPRPPAAPAQ